MGVSNFFKADKTLPNSPKILRVAQLAGIEPDLVLGRMWRFWSWVDDHVRSDGSLGGVTVTLLSQIMRYDVTFFVTLQDAKVQWLGENSDGSLYIPKTDKWFGSGRKERTANAERQKRYRDSHKADVKRGSNGNRNVTSVTLRNAPDKSRGEESINTGLRAGAHAREEPPLEASAGPVAGVFKGVDRDTLADSGKLLDWYRDASGRNAPVVKHSEANRLRVFAAAEHALAKGDNPPAMFAWLVSKAQWSHITQADEERARNRLASMGKPPASPRSKPPDVDAETARSRDEELAKLAKATARAP